MANEVFNSVSPLRPGRSVFDLSYEKKLTCQMGKLIPIMADEMVPGDKFQITNEIVVRFQPMVAPILHEVNVYVHYFFVPYRLLWDDWEDFITGGPDGDFTAVIPTWEPTDTDEGSLWDYMGFPIGVDPEGAYPIDFVRSGYNLIYDEYYRDQTLVEPVDPDNESVLTRAWEKDYFTAALPWQQRGTAPALPISGQTTAAWDSDAIDDQGSDIDGAAVIGVNLNDQFAVSGPTREESLLGALNRNTVDLSVASTFDIADLRLAFQIQKFLERNARTGARYTEFLQAHHNVSPTDERLQRPEFCGGSKSPVVISEVLQTSETDPSGPDASPQGNMAGHGITASRTQAANYFCKEYGMIFGIMSIMPRSAYQQGIDRQFIKRTKYDFFFPEFVNLSEQGIEQAELFATNDAAENQSLFGYAGRYDEMRVKKNMVAGQMRSEAAQSLDYWHLARDFESAPALNQEFIECVPSTRIFAVQDEDPMIVNVANIIRAVRPLPFANNPGLVDHH